MRVGVLYTDDRVEEKSSVFDCMYSFILGRRFAKEWGSAYAKPVCIVQQNEDGTWGKLKPTPQQIKDCKTALTTWEAYNQSEQYYRA